MTAAFLFSDLTIGPDEVAELAIDGGGLLDAGIEHRTPFAGIVVESDGAEEIAGLEDDLKCVAEVVREPANLLGVLDGNGWRAGGVSHTDVNPLARYGFFLSSKDEQWGSLFLC